MRPTVNRRPPKVEPSKRKNLSARVTFRFSLDEYDALSKLADKNSCTISQVIRMILFGNNKKIQGVLSLDDEQISEQLTGNSLENIRSDFKKLAGEYNEITAAVKQKISEGKVSDAGIERSFRSMEEVTLQLQKTLNSVLREKGVREVHEVSRTARFGGEERSVAVRLSAKDYENFLILYCYMEKMQIIGVVADDAAEYEREGIKKMKFRVLVERAEKNGKKKIPYNVYAEKTSIFEHIKKGSWVFVLGDFAEDSKGQKVIFPDDIRLCGNQ